MAYIEIHFENAHKSLAETLAHELDQLGHISSLIVRDERREWYELSQFLELHTTSNARAILITDTFTLHKPWLRREIELVARLLLNQDTKISKMILFGLVGLETINAFPFHNASVSWFSLDSHNGITLSKLKKLLPVPPKWFTDKDKHKAVFKNVEELNNRHQEFCHTIINNSKGKEFLDAIQEWKLEYIGYTLEKDSCELCGKWINSFAKIHNSGTSATLICGLTCYRRLHTVLVAEEIPNGPENDNDYRNKQKTTTIRLIAESMKLESGRPLASIDYGSWRQWFLEMESSGKLPEELHSGVRDLKHLGILGSDLLISRFIDYHNSNRRFPIHILLPFSRLRGCLSNFQNLPDRITINQAKDFAYGNFDNTQAVDSLLAYIVSHFDGHLKSRQSQLKLAYNYLVTAYRIYHGCSGKSKRNQFIQSHPLFKLNSALVSSIDKKHHTDIEFQNLMMLMGELIHCAFKEYCADNLSQKYMNVLMSRLEKIASTGRIAPIWPLAPASCDLEFNWSPERGIEQAKVLPDFFSMSSIPSEFDKYLTKVILEEWEEIVGSHPIDIILSGVWIQSRYRDSGITARLGKTRCDFVLGLNKCWEEANKTQLRAIIRVLLRDVCQDLQDVNDLQTMQDFLGSVNLTPISQKNLAYFAPTMNAVDELRDSFNMEFADRSKNMIPPTLVVSSQEKDLAYSRWSHVLLFPESYFFKPPQKKSLHNITSQFLSVLPAKFDPYQLTRKPSRSFGINEWFSLTPSWIAPESKMQSQEPILGWLKPKCDPLQVYFGRSKQPIISSPYFVIIDNNGNAITTLTLTTRIDSRVDIRTYGDYIHYQIQIDTEAYPSYRITLIRAKMPLSIVGTNISISEGESAEIDCGSVIRFRSLDKLLRIF